MSKTPQHAFINGKIITVDKNFSIQEALLIEGDIIIAVGTNSKILELVDPKTIIHDLNGQTVIPGLIDCHAHLDREGLKSVFPSLGKVRSIQEIQNRPFHFHSQLPNEPKCWHQGFSLKVFSWFFEFL